MTNFTIQIISDTICPWCYIGFKRLSTAIITHKKSHPDDTFTLHWKAFYLNPSSPSYPGVNKREMYAAKFGAARTDAIIARLSSVGENEGIKFSFGGNSGRTRDSHRVIWYAGNVATTTGKDSGSEGFGIQSAVRRRILLIRLIGVEEEVDAEAGDAARKLVSGVPFFEIQGKYVIEGADEPEAFLEVFERVKNGE
ncbi:uncharacterized protein N7469_010000 [Penicillium citrinum]|uniref:DSBA-like thioredoxin domain-containing protein n=1 Tax=Penicillium citrinum TaxID=5077 RepID=A0A9W9NJW9_PENCI|nr:uncharacterized protein N7469_010000 [Penicillium citrinum]KAJ5221113.1 hypothetical protein N7469_010000 [Penicillium citrinum]